ncbi:MAG: penicillin-binding protein 2 [Patescibacteria group bacterium]
MGRVRGLFIFFCLCAVGLLGKLYLVQIVSGDAFSDEANRKGTSSGNLFDRGSVYFEDKTGERISAATLASGFLIAITPKDIEDSTETYAVLSAITSIDENIFSEAVARTEDPYEEIAHRVGEAEALQIRDLELPGVFAYEERWRLYPGGTSAAHTLGLIGFDGDTLGGRYGIERYYERVLSRENKSVYRNFFAEVFSGVGDVIDAKHGEGEGDVVMTIEPTVQNELEQSLSGIIEEWKSKKVGGIILDPRTGEIRAIAALPSFDPNNFSDIEDPLVFSNPIVENVFEMGSIMKALTMAAGLDAGVVTPETTFNDKGSLTIDGYTIYNHDKKVRGTTDMQHVLGESLNTGAAFVEGKLGNARFARYFEKFGLGTETGIDLPGEVAGLLGNLKSPRDGEYVTASFGQGIAVTPIGMARALSAIANGGTLITPHVVKEIEYDIGISHDILHPEETRVISREASETITQMLVNVVDNFLLGGTVKISTHSIAAKTGTAQIANPADGGYYADRYLHSFFGYFPAYDPQFLILLFSYEPQGARFASETLTTPFMDLARFLIHYYTIPPDR